MLSFIRSIFGGGSNANTAQHSCRKMATAYCASPKSNSKPVRFNVKPASKTSVLVQAKLKETGTAIENKATNVAQSIKLKTKSIKNLVTGLSKKGHQKHERNLYLQFLKSSQGDIIESKPEDIALVVNYASRMINEGTASEKDKEDIRSLFTKLASVPEKNFNRQFFLADQDKLQRVISPDLDKLLTAQEKNSALKDDQQHQLDISIAEARLIFALGIDPTQRAGGCNGAVLVRNLKDEVVGVFKGPPNRKWDIVAAFKDCFGQNRLFNRRNRMNEPLSEVFTRYFDDVFGLNLIPAATMVEFNNESGAFIAFLGGYQELADVKKELESRDSYSTEELVKWQLAIVTIFATLNFDPHDGNIFVRTKINEKGEKIITDIKIIDGGNNFAEVLPGQWGTKGHRREPGNLKISKQKFTPEIIEFIRNNMTDARYEQFAEKVKKERPDFLSDDMDALLRKTMQVLRDAVISGDIANPHELLNVLTDVDYSQHIKQKPLREDMDDWVVLDIGDEQANKVLNSGIIG